MVESDCYTQVNDDLQDWIANRTPNASLRKMALRVMKHATPEQWVKYYWWDALVLDTDTCLDISPTLRNLDADFPIQSIGIGKIGPNTLYPLHVDTNRGCGINMMLSDCNLHATESFCAWVDEDTNETYQLKYEQDTMYLLNTQLKHTVFNFVSERVMFMVEFEADRKDLSYDTMKKLCQEGTLPDRPKRKPYSLDGLQLPKAY